MNSNLLNFMLKLKEERGLGASLTSETGSLVDGEVFWVFFSLVVIVAGLAGLYAMRGWSWLSKFPYFFFDLRWYLLGVLLAFSPFPNSLIWMFIRDYSYADWVKWGKGDVSSIQWISEPSSSISSPSSWATRLFWRGVWILWSSLSFPLYSLGKSYGTLLLGLLKPLLSTFWGFLYVGFPSSSHLSILAERDFSTLVVSSLWRGRG